MNNDHLTDAERRVRDFPKLLAKDRQPHLICKHCAFTAPFDEALAHYEQTGHSLMSSKGVVQNLADALKRIQREREDRAAYEAAREAGEKWAHKKYGQPEVSKATT